MNSLLTITRKELRSLFGSPIALIFLCIFLGVTLFTFFTTSRFFARNLADARPLFQWLPILLIGLVSAVTMRAWAEERRAGTLEILLTLPVKTYELVLGKFLAGWALVVVALVLTLPIPFTVSGLGNLDWGPVIGGYIGAALLAAAYLAIGLCVSARTDNQVVALMVTLVIGGLMYLIGTDGVVGLFGSGTAEILRSLGSGSRFESIERGVLDLRDLTYYGSITAFFLVLNGYFLDQQRLDPGSASGGKRRLALALLVSLTGLNAVAANAWLAPVHQVRIDLTETGEYSISEVTKATLASLDEPLVIHGYFSERSHPLLMPLIPQIRDLLAEYEIAGDGSVDVAFLDPSTDEELEQEIGEQYAIRSFPFGVNDRNSQSVVNSFFHILIRYGDEYEVLSFQDLIDVKPDGEAGIEVRLRSLEYDFTRTIKKVSQEFQSLEAILSKLPGEAKITAYITPALLPEGFGESATAIREVSKSMADASGGKLTFTEIDPSGDADLQQRLMDEYGVRPMAKDFFGRDVFYMHILIQLGDTVERIMPRGELTAADLRQAIEAAIKRGTPGQLKTVAVFTEQPVAPPPNPQIPPQYQPPPPQPDYRAIQQVLGEFYQIQPTQLDDGYVPDQVDVLVVGKTGAMNAKQQFAIDQFLMRGGAVVALAGAYRVSAGRQGLSAAAEDTSLFDLLETYGIRIENSIVMDPANAKFPIPVMEQRGQFQIQSVKLIAYPPFPDIRNSGFNPQHAALASLGNVTMPWSSPVTLTQPDMEGVTFEYLLETSDESWLNATGNIDPDFKRFPEKGFGPSGDIGKQVVAATGSGRFTSYFADKTNPLFSDEEGGRTLKSSVADGRLVVLGSSELASDIMMQLAQQPNGEVHRGNLQLLQNVIDWSVADTDLLSIRTGGAFARTLVPMTDEERTQAELMTYAPMLALMIGIVAIPLVRRRMVKPIPMKEAK